MKKVILMAVAVLSIKTASAQTNTATPDNTGVNTQMNTGVQTPSLITNHFNVDYPNNTATWYQDGSNYRGEYMDSKTNTGRVAIYDKNGVRIGTEEQLSNGTYPSTISEYYTKKYPNETDYQVWSTNDGLGNTTYYTNRNSETYWFDKTGKYKNKTKKRTYNNKPETKK
ncbi:MAG: hypothetical protein H0W73_19340 [Bacteroidetes bacterium]|nr:hypothetical protein [Bacteroidota bacterium]